MKKTKNNKQFLIEFRYRENKNQHEICESWLCKSLNSFKEILSDALDVYSVDENGNYVPMQSFEEIHRNLERFGDEKFIKKEYKRLKKNHKIYDELIKCVNECTHHQPFSFKIDSKTTLKVVCYF